MFFKVDLYGTPYSQSLQKRLGWVKGEYEGEEVIAHGGDTFTTHTFITLSREREYGIFSSTTGGRKGEFLRFICAAADLRLTDG